MEELKDMKIYIVDMDSYTCRKFKSESTDIGDLLFS